VITWRKSSRSGGTTTQSDCVEVAQLNHAVGIRDSKAPDAGYLALPAEGFARLVQQLKQGRPDT
jgi:hypothetical protein